MEKRERNRGCVFLEHFPTRKRSLERHEIIPRAWPISCVAIAVAKRPATPGSSVQFYRILGFLTLLWIDHEEQSFSAGITELCCCHDGVRVHFAFIDFMCDLLLFVNCRCQGYFSEPGDSRFHWGCWHYTQHLNMIPGWFSYESHFFDVQDYSCKSVFSRRTRPVLHNVESCSFAYSVCGWVSMRLFMCCVCLSKNRLSNTLRIPFLWVDRPCLIDHSLPRSLGKPVHVPVVISFCVLYRPSFISCEQMCRRFKEIAHPHKYPKPKKNTADTALSWSCTLYSDSCFIWKWCWHNGDHRTVDESASTEATSGFLSKGPQKILNWLWNKWDA